MIRQARQPFLPMLRSGRDRRREIRRLPDRQCVTGIEAAWRPRGVSPRDKTFQTLPANQNRSSDSGRGPYHSGRK